MTRKYVEVKISKQCPVCKNADTTRIIGQNVKENIDIEPYLEFYGSAPFEAYYCPWCEYKFSFLRQWIKKEC